MAETMNEPRLQDSPATLEQSGVGAAAGLDPGAKPGRVVSLDVFRGMTIAAMILVNNAGGPMYAPFDHAEWNGWTHTDLIFPFFMFISGAAMALSMSRRSGASPKDSQARLRWHVIRRGAIIFGIGLWLNLFPWFFTLSRYSTLRIPGVLQRIGFCYVFAGIIYLWTSRQPSAFSRQQKPLNTKDTEASIEHQSQKQNRTAPEGALQSKSKALSFDSGLTPPHRASHSGDPGTSFAQDDTRLKGAWIRAGIVVVLLLGYWAAMKLIPVPGVGAGDLTPNNNLAAYIDNMTFGARHMWQHRPWDPEGLLSSVPALCTMLLGTFVGELMTPRQRELTGTPSLGVQELGSGFQEKPSSTEGAEGVSSQIRLEQTAQPGTAVPHGPMHSPLQSTWQYKVKQLTGWGIAAVVLGEVWGIWFPINKSLWTSSYVVFTAGYAMLVLAAVYWVVDVRGWRKWATPFLIFGSNAILVFTLSTWVTKLLLVIRVPSDRVVEGQRQSMSAWSWVILHSWHGHLGDPRNAAMAFALSYVLIWLAIMWWFYRRRIFVKI